MVVWGHAALRPGPDGRGDAAAAKSTETKNTRMNTKPYRNEQNNGKRSAAAVARLATAREQIRQARGELTFLTGLDPRQRKSAPRLSPARMQLLDQAVQAIGDHDNMLPEDTAAEYSVAVAECRGLYDLARELDQLLGDVNDTMTARAHALHGRTLQIRVTVGMLARHRPAPVIKAWHERLNPRSARRQRARKARGGRSQPAPNPGTAGPEEPGAPPEAHEPPAVFSAEQGAA